MLFGFSLGPWPIQFHVLVSPLSVGLHLTEEQTLNPIRYCLVNPISLVILLHNCMLVSCSQETTFDQRVCNWIDLYMSPFYRMQSTFWYHDHQSTRVKVLGRNQLIFFMFNKLYWCCIQQYCLTLILCRATNSLSHSLGCFHASFHRPYFANDSTHFQTCKFHLAARKGLVVAFSSLLFGDPFENSFFYLSVCLFLKKILQQR